MEVGISMRTVVLLTSLLLLCASAALAQGRGWPKPPEPADRTQVKAATPDSRPRIDPLQLQREARELSDLANSIPTDMDRVSHGLLPKDTIDKLKRIEKLSKHLRGELNP
jgi:hypothetical protein